MVDITQEAISLLRSLEDGYMPGLAYDTAWSAMVPESTTSDKPLFPKSLLWLITNQNEDGSWGSEVDYYYDRLISTLASIIAFKKTHKSDKFKHIIEDGEDYIWYNIKRLYSDPNETIGFELIFPSLMSEAEKLELNLPYRERFIEPLKERKMKLGGLSNSLKSQFLMKKKYINSNISLKQCIIILWIFSISIQIYL